MGAHKVFRARFDNFRLDPKTYSPEKGTEGNWWIFSDLEDEVEKNLEHWGKKEPQTEESLRNRIALEELQEDMRAWKEGYLMGDIRDVSDTPQNSRRHVAGWITGKEVLVKLRIPHFQLLKLMKDGLQGYDDKGKKIIEEESLPYCCPIPKFSLKSMVAIERGKENAGKVLGGSWSGHPSEYAIEQRAKEAFKSQIHVVRTSPPKGCSAMPFTIPEDKKQNKKWRASLESLLFRESDLRGYYADETQGRFPVPPKPEPVQQESSLVPQDIRSGFEPAIKDSVEPQEAPPDNYFHLNGDLWEIHYEGETCHLKDFDGMRYIKILLDGPQGGIKTTELYHAVHYSGEIEASLVDLDLNDTEESTKNKPFDTIALETTDVDEIMDPQTSRETQERLKAIKIELVSVQHDGPKREALKEEKKKILAYLEDGFAQKRFRKFIDEQERSRKKVSAAIKRALKKMKAACPKTGTHFTAAIKTGVECSYKPNQPTSWGARPLKK